MTLPPEVVHIIETLNENNYQAFAVGGCVRDYILNLEPKDWDITTDALPSDVKSLFEKTIDTGIAHGTVTVMLGKSPFEVTTFRRDGKYSDGRRPDSVEFSSSIEEDLQRRDFTINAIAYHPTKGVIDLFNGLEDLQNNIIRCVGNPNDRFQEDALRMMRAIRFAAKLGFIIEDNTKEAIITNAKLIANVSMERFRDEFMKILMSDCPGMLHTLFMCKLLKPVDPFLDKYFEAYFRNVGYTLEAHDKDEISRLALLFGKEKPHNIKDLMKRMHFSNEQKNKVFLIIKELQNPPPTTMEGARRIMNRIGIELTPTYVQCMRQIAGGKSEPIYSMLTLFLQSYEDPMFISDLAINGEDIKQLGAEGKLIGEILNECLDLVLINPIHNDKTTLRQVAISKIRYGK